MNTADQPLRRAYIGLGANLGEARATLEAACTALAALPQTCWIARSAWVESDPVDAQGPVFTNGVAALDSTLDPLALLDALQAIELVHKRERPYRNAPRTLDLDLLLYGELVLDQPRLMLPHPRLHLRAFALAPLLELAPDIRLLGRPATGWLAAITDQPIRRLPG